MRAQEASVVGIGAAALEGAGVAGIGGSAIVKDTTLIVRIGSSQLETRRAFPYIHVLEIHKPGVSVTLGALMRLARQQLQDERRRNQHQGIAGG
jgi:hypothetical protein